MRRKLEKIPVFLPGDDRARGARYFVSAVTADAWVQAGFAISIKGRSIVLLRAPEFRLRDVSGRMSGRDIEDFAMGKRRTIEALEAWAAPTASADPEGGP